MVHIQKPRPFMPVGPDDPEVAVLHSELRRLLAVDEVARALLSEWDNPVPDYALRSNLKQRLLALCQWGPAP